MYNYYFIYNFAHRNKAKVCMRQTKLLACLTHFFFVFEERNSNTAKCVPKKRINRGHSLSHYIFLATALKKLVTVQARCPISFKVTLKNQPCKQQAVLQPLFLSFSL